MTAQSDQVPPSSTPVSSRGKESEAVSLTGKEAVQEIPPKIEIHPEVKKTGVEVREGTLEVPPDVKKLGVTPSGPQTPVSALPATVSLPISDDKIFQGVNAPLTSAWKWLSNWCIRNLLKAHLALKKIHGKIVRVRVR